MLHQDLLPMDAATPLCNFEPEGTAVGMQSSLCVPATNNNDNTQPILVPFRDAERMEPTNFFLSILDCLEGLHRAVKLGWFDLATFDCREYFFHEKPCNGDFNWVVPNKLMAFANPAAEQPPTPPPAIYFLTPGTRTRTRTRSRTRTNTDTVVNRGACAYLSRPQRAQGIAHHDLIFPDGSTPSIRIIDEFFRIVESCDGAVAVHCKGGFGRTGTLIACYMIKHHGFTAREAIGWIRLCRPGSIVGRQQQFLVTYDPRSWLADRSQLTTPLHRVEDVMRNPGRFARVLAKSKRARQASLLPPLTMMRPSETAATQLTIEAPELDDAALPSSKPQLSLSTPSMAALQECDCNDDGVVTTVQLGAKRARDELVEESVRCSQREPAAAVLRTSC